MWQIPLIQDNLKKLFQEKVNNLPKFLDNLQSIGALNQEFLKKSFSLITTNWPIREFASIFNNENLWQILKKMPPVDAQRLLKKIIDSPSSTDILEIVLNFTAKHEYNFADCERWVDGILKINNFKD